MPLGATVLDAVSPLLAWITVGLFAITNLKVGAQWTLVPPARVTVPLTMMSAAACAASALWLRRRPAASSGVAPA